jgi:hypothetical protein
MEGGPWSRYGPNSCLSFASCLWSKQLPLQWAPAMTYFWALYRSKGNGAKWWCTENSKANRQYKSFLLLSWFSQVYCHNDRKLNKTGKNYSIPKSNMDLKKLNILLPLSGTRTRSCQNKVPVVAPSLYARERSEEGHGVRCQLLAEVTTNYWCSAMTTRMMQCLCGLRELYSILQMCAITLIPSLLAAFPR